MEASPHVGLAAPTLAKLAVVGGGPPFIKLGRTVRCRYGDLVAWRAARTVTSTTDARARGVDRLAPKKGDCTAAA